MIQCDNCGEMASDLYGRVFADNDGVLHGCPSCTPQAASKHPDKQQDKKV